MRVFAVASFGLALIGASAGAQEREAQVSPDEIKKGAALFARHCATCHERVCAIRNGPSICGHSRATATALFVDSVSNGKRNMPPWDDVLDPGEIEALRAYVIAAESGD